MLGCPLVNLTSGNKLRILEVFMEALVDSSITRSCEDVEDRIVCREEVVTIHKILNIIMSTCEIILNTVSDMIPKRSVTATTVIIVCLYKLTPPIHMLSEVVIETITLELSRQRCLL
tara:strand:+ start:338 stop:688 length:351 start_codon:yes stop_codon:yes gene_type:complete